MEYLGGEGLNNGCYVSGDIWERNQETTRGVNEEGRVLVYAVNLLIALGSWSQNIKQEISFLQYLDR